MASKYWWGIAGASQNDWDTNANWSSSQIAYSASSKPTSADNIWVSNGAYSILQGMTNESGVTAATINIVGPTASGDTGLANGFHGSIGSDSAGSLNITAERVNILGAISPIYYSGNVVVNTSVATSGVVYVDGTSAQKNGVTLGGSMVGVQVARGNVVISSTATMPTGGSAAWSFNGGRTIIEDCTMPTGTTTGNAATLTVEGDAWVETQALPSSAGSSVKVRGGTLNAYKNDTCPDIEVTAGVFKFNGGAWPTMMTVRGTGTLDLSDNPFDFSSAPITHAKGATIILPRKSSTISFTETKIAGGATIRGGGSGNYSGISGFSPLGD